jgi:hypothetical protein
MTATTRLFCARPAGVELDATGFELPAPLTDTVTPLTCQLSRTPRRNKLTIKALDLLIESEAAADATSSLYPVNTTLLALEADICRANLEI